MPPVTPAPPRPPSVRWIATLSCVVFAVVVLRSAWLCDDAYITLRTASNLTSGLGATWNPSERVQAYTHPLWMALVAAVGGATGSWYTAPILLGAALSLAGTGVILFASATAAGSLVVASGLILSKAWVDYATSGLENPLSHLLIAVFLLLCLRGSQGPAPLGLLAGLAGAIALCRLDLLILVAPALLASAAGVPVRRAVKKLAIGFAPLAAWEAFSLVYYGSLVPNTALAKLATGIPLSDRIVQGGHYLANSLREDPVTLPAIAAGLLAAALPGARARFAVALGVVGYLAYVVSVGGDFMSGRLLTVPLAASACLLATARLPRVVAGVAGAILLALGLLSPSPTLWNGRTYSEARTASGRALVDAHGISDERAVFFPFTGLLRSGDASPETHPWARSALAARRSGVAISVIGPVGLHGFHAGPDVHVVDRFALADALLARLPAASDRPHRIGHFERLLPVGYVRSLMTGRNELEDPALRRCFADVALVTRAPLFSAARAAALWRTARGSCAPAAVSRGEESPDAAILAASLDARGREHPLPIPANGVDVYLEATWTAPSLTLRRSRGADYRLRLYRGNREIAQAVVPPPQGTDARGLGVVRIRVPKAAAHAGFDRVRVLAEAPDPAALLASLEAGATGSGALDPGEEPSDRRVDPGPR